MYTKGRSCHLIGDRFAGLLTQYPKEELQPGKVQAPRSLRL